jgi:GAF domain-containing protein
LLGSRVGLLAAALTGITSLVYLLLNVNQVAPFQTLLLYNPTSVWIVYSVIFLAMAGLVQLANASAGQALRSAREHAEAQAQANRELEATRQSLEAQVVERTRDLQTRTQYLQAAVEISRATASILDSKRLIQTSVDLIREQFELYYAGLFLVDPGGEWAVLQAGTGEAGEKLVQRNHRIRVGSGMVGWSVVNAQPRIALDVSQDVVRTVNPELPETRSEAAIPLRSRGKVLGALTVQTTRPDAFGEVEIAIFQSMADQLAIALDNARLFGESQQALEEARRAQGQISRGAWQEFLRSTGERAMRYRYGQVAGSAEAAGDGLEAARRRAIEERYPVQVVSNDESGRRRTILLLPIPVRDQVVGAISFAKESEDPWQDDEVELLETICEQLGVALDSARLYQDTQRRAYREQLAGEVTARIRQTLDIQTVLRTAVEEVQRSLNLPEVVISLAPPEN